MSGLERIHVSSTRALRELTDEAPDSVAHVGLEAFHPRASLSRVTTRGYSTRAIVQTPPAEVIASARRLEVTPRCQCPDAAPLEGAAATPLVGVLGVLDAVGVLGVTGAVAGAIGVAVAAGAVTTDSGASGTCPVIFDFCTFPIV
jgi:hypothetical protein